MIIRFIATIFVLIVPVVSLFSIEQLSVKHEKAFAGAVVSTENGKKYFEKRELEKAEKCFRKAIRKFPYMHEAYYYISKIHYIGRRYHSALRNIDKAVGTFEKLFVYTGQRDKEMIMKLKSRYRNIKEAEKEIPDNVYGCKRNAYASAKAGMQKNLEAIDARIRKLSEGSLNKETVAYYLFQKGNVLVKLNKVVEAVKLYREAIEQKSDLKDAWTNLIVITMSKEGRKKGYKILEQAEAAGVEIDKRLKEELLKE